MKFITDPKHYVNPIFLLENKKSPVIYIRGINTTEINSLVILNLFGNFGRIQKILILKLKSIVLIEYESIDFSTNAKNYLNNTIFLGNKLKVFKLIIAD